jgi:hypothetical protein
MQARVLIAAIAVIAVAAGFVALQSEPEPPAPRIVATEPSTPRLVEIGGETILNEPGSGGVVIEHGSESDTGPIGALERAP